MFYNLVNGKKKILLSEELVTIPFNRLKKHRSTSEFDHRPDNENQPVSQPPTL